MPVFVCPLDNRLTGTTQEGVEAAFTHYLGVSGVVQYPADGIFPLNGVIRIPDIRDGTSQTIAAGERPPGPDGRWGWWYAGVGQDNTGSADMILSAETSRTTYRTPTCVPGPYRYGPGTLDNICDIFHFWSLHPGGAHFLFADGGVRFVRYEIGDGLKALASKSSGDGPVPLD
jgi:prepilin-type processing-associated H-X9-DG protein